MKKILKAPEFYGGLIIGSIICAICDSYNWLSALAGIIGIIGVIETLKK